MPEMLAPDFHDALCDRFRAALNEVGEAPKSHKGLQHQLREVYVVDGSLDAKYHSLLCDAEDKRLEADYEVTPSVTEEDAEEWSRRAKDFVDTMEAMFLERQYLILFAVTIAATAG